MTYWFNTRTNLSTYTRPTLSAPVPEPAPTPQYVVPPYQPTYGPTVSAYGDAASAPAAKRARTDEHAAASHYDHSANAVSISSVGAGVGGGGTDSSANTSTLAARSIGSAYDRHAGTTQDERFQSSILHMRNLNNWVKATLISHYSPRPALKVLDLACGKLGDLRKWKLAGVQQYCGIDISATGLTDGVSRFCDINSDLKMRAKFVRADLGDVDLAAAGVFGHGEKFDVISIQFALHYVFLNAQRALTFFKNISDLLAPGSVFIGTIPDAAYLVRRLRDLPPPSRTFSNSVFKIEFTEEGYRRQWALGDNPFGVEYNFYLAESVDHVPEFLLPWPLLERLAASVGLKPVEKDNFHAFFQRMSGLPQHR